MAVSSGGAFAHLHCHSEYSMLDGASRIGDLISFAKDQGMPGLALTDGVMYGAVKFYKEARAAGIKPLVGCEVYVTADRNDRSRAPYYHLTLIARTAEGQRRNLMKLSTCGFLQGFYYKPRVDLEMLRKYGRGIICLSGCLSAEVPTRVLEEGVPMRREGFCWSMQIFDDVYLELQDHGIEQQRRVNEGLYRLHKETGIPLVAANDSHYTTRNDARMHDVLLCIDGQVLRRPQQDEVLGPGVLRQDRRRDGQDLPRPSRGAREHDQSRGERRGCGDRAGQDAPA